MHALEYLFIYLRTGSLECGVMEMVYVNLFFSGFGEFTELCVEWRGACIGVGTIAPCALPLPSYLDLLLALMVIAPAGGTCPL